MNAPPKELPDEQLSKIISQALIDAELVAGDKLEKLAQKITAGRMNSADWRIYIESAIVPSGES